MARLRSIPVNALAGLTLGTTGFTSISESTTGSPADYHTVIRFQGTLGAIAGGASLGLGRKLLDLPVGPSIVISAAHLSCAVKSVAGNSANTPVLGAGTVVASGAVSVLSGTATFQDIVTGLAAANANGTAMEQLLVANKTFLPNASSRSLFLNAAAAWSVADAAAQIYGTFRMNWTRFG